MCSWSPLQTNRKTRKKREIPTYGCGSKKTGTQNGSLLNGNRDKNLRSNSWCLKFIFSPYPYMSWSKPLEPSVWQNVLTHISTWSPAWSKPRREKLFGRRLLVDVLLIDLVRHDHQLLLRRKLQDHGLGSIGSDRKAARRSRSRKAQMPKERDRFSS